MAGDTNIGFFNLLKSQVASTLRKKYPGNNQDISKWKGQEIKLFQEHLTEKVQSRISEKWFYTHLKSKNDTLPRVDILNLLSQYCDYKDWEDFKNKNIKKVSSKNYSLLYTLPIILIIPVFWLSFSNRDFDYSFMVVDGITLKSLVGKPLEIYWIKDGETPVHLNPASSGEYHLKSDNDHITLLIKAPYYQTDTIIRNLNKRDYHEIIPLQPDDYALMINYYSKSEVKEWEDRRGELDKIIAHNATIFQVDNQGKGMEMYNKNEFIDLLTFPYSRLKNIEVLETRVSKEKILFLRFKTTENEK